MVRKSGSTKPAKPAKAGKPQAVLSLEDIAAVAGFVPSGTGAARVLPQGFTRSGDNDGKVSPFSKAKKGGFSYEYPKGSPFKMVQKEKTHGETVYADLVEAERRGLVKWNQVVFPVHVLKVLQKNLDMLEK